MTNPNPSSAIVEEVFAPPKLYPLPEPPPPSFVDPYQSYQTGVPIVIDLGTWHTRAGFTTDQTPQIDFPTQLSRYRDRKILRTFTLVGNDANLDANTRQAAKSPFDGPLVSNWDYLETIFDYVFVKLGVSSDRSVDNPIVMSEILAAPLAQHKGMQELFFETYGVPSLACGIDSLFSFDYNGGKTGLVVSAGHETTNVIPVLNGRGILSQAKRLNWGGHQSASFLLSLLQLKYPIFPTKLTPWQAEILIRDHCYVAPEAYDDELAGYLTRDDSFDERNHVIQAPFTEIVAPVKSEEELARQAERRKESGRKLQEQAAKLRLEKLMKKEKELEYFREIEAKSDELSHRDFKRLLTSEGFEDEASLVKTIKNLDKAIRRSRKQDVGDDDGEVEMDFSLLEIPDGELDETQIRQKRAQRLMKANYDARMRAKEEKKKEIERRREEERKDEEWRAKDLEGWIKDRREARDQVVNRIKDKKRLKEELNNRRSLASQMRMKSIANLAADSPSGSARKRRRGGNNDDDDDFGADDDDWAVYRDIANASDTEEDEEMNESKRKIEEQLLLYDPDFSLENTLEFQNDWKQSLVHAFLRGSRPFDPTSRSEAHQIHLNVERIRVPEVLFQPSIAGIDQAGIVELASDILLRRLDTVDGPAACKDIFLTGGYSLLHGLDDRLRHDLRALLPVGTDINVRRADNALLDTWKGMRKWISDAQNQKLYSVTKADYEEFGGDYLKEHRLGNMAFS
ncbi:uncharacterized protein V1516DRAFT_710270 [Lipomyces oligophaga]|uniref:uncharacterized protein n=1 Tax=Lipomyces oligophaga TaxID=45792 RepID=UPI0034CEFEA9